MIGAVFGAAMAGERGLFGAAVGFLLVYLLVALSGMRNRLLRSESDLNVLRLRVTELSARATVSAAAAGAQTEAADTADFPQPKPPLRLPSPRTKPGRSGRKRSLKEL